LTPLKVDENVRAVLTDLRNEVMMKIPQKEKFLGFINGMK